jgi:hypothetical protein
MGLSEIRQRQDPGKKRVLQQCDVAEKFVTRRLGAAGWMNGWLDGDLGGLITHPHPHHRGSTTFRLDMLRQDRQDGPGCILMMIF